MGTDKIVKIIGRVEPVVFPEIGNLESFARIDTGAQTSAIWASSIRIKDGLLSVKFLGPEHPAYSGETFYFAEYSDTVVASSNGQSEVRYKVKLLVNIGDKRIRARFTLADRSTQVYPVLIGRNVLRGKFMVDVKLGTPLINAEKQRSIALRARLKQGDQS